MAGKVDIEDGNLVFKLTGVDEILALKSALKVPLNHVKSVSTEKADWNYFSMLKVAGARLPGVVVDGRYIDKEGMLFYEMHDPDKCVTVELSDELYKKVVFEVENKEEVASMIKKAIKK
ncbi:MAG: hypothetical protein ACREBH_01105 [Candidatus Micrarchaeaceae archaeon]